MIYVFMIKMIANMQFLLILRCLNIWALSLNKNECESRTYNFKFVHVIVIIFGTKHGYKVSDDHLSSFVVIDVYLNRHN